MRSLLHVLLGIQNNELEHLRDNGYHYYARLLGFREDSKEVLSAIHRNSSLPLYTKAADYHNLSLEGKRMIDKDMMASDLYESVVTDKFDYPFISELQKQIIKI